MAGSLGKRGIRQREEDVGARYETISRPVRSFGSPKERRRLSHLMGGVCIDLFWRGDEGGELLGVEIIDKHDESQIWQAGERAVENGPHVAQPAVHRYVHAAPPHLIAT